MGQKTSGSPSSFRFVGQRTSGSGLLTDFGQPEHTQRSYIHIDLYDSVVSRYTAPKPLIWVWASHGEREGIPRPGGTSNGQHFMVLRSLQSRGEIGGESYGPSHQVRSATVKSTIKSSLQGVPSDRIVSRAVDLGYGHKFPGQVA